MTTDREQIIATLRDIVTTLLLENEGQAQFSNQDSLVLSRRLSSLQVVELATQLETQYQLDFSKLGFNQYDFDTIDSMVALIEHATRPDMSS